MTGNDLRLRISLVCALVVIAPAGREWLDGRLPTAGIAWRYLAALLLAWMGSGILLRIAATYRPVGRLHEAVSASPARRRSDHRDGEERVPSA